MPSTIDPVALYSAPGRYVPTLPTERMKQEFAAWIALVDPILAEHNIQHSDPITVALPPFSFTPDSSAARRLNRHVSSAPSSQQFSEIAQHIVTGSVAESVAATAATAATVTESVTESVAESVTASVTASVAERMSERMPEIPERMSEQMPLDTSSSVEDVYHMSISPESNFHAWASAHYSSEHMLSLIPSSFAPAHGSTISEHFNAFTVRGAKLQPLLEYLVAARQNAGTLDHCLEFLNGETKEIDTELIFANDQHVEATVRALRSRQSPTYAIERTSAL